ncbi:MAG TPA: hypothetical protein VFQ65_02230 [Kofleriaceae bacterium]|nr:hypothetical protein [Kofleriaceae bacterium]
MRTSCIVLVLAFTGCASAPPIVPASDWECVSPRPRATLDTANAAELAHVHAEVAVAQTELAHARQAVRPVAVARKATAPAIDVDAIWAPVVADQEHRKADALARVRGANDTWVAARLAWSERHLRAAVAHVAVVEAQIQLARATWIDRHLLGSDTYETAPFRAELARTQAPYYAALHDEAAASVALVDASAKIASAKEEYASLARTAPTLPGSPTLASPKLQLAGFAIDRHAKPSYLKLR